ncbi:uncharacterized protein LOC124113686 [Haliotis rufescens]|uniref:uncharacterized protein LOC124113686 n=1 Tax=Haliotis rufescens TaxID=6454 RepID=UPI00201E9D10|nr:uncharacterized protein LOC124113686 [Haliotis rufescens]XP_046330124.2 uncharacterized protein LOC124113686 [Haliotis rufescens]
MGNQKEPTRRRPKRSRLSSAGKLLPVHNLGFDDNNDDLESVSFLQSSESLGSSSDTKIPELVCSKFAVIGDPRSRKIKHRTKTKYWTMPVLGKENSLLVAESNDRLFDRKNLYGTKQRKQYQRLVRDKTVVASADTCTPRRSMDKERDYILADYYRTGDFKKYERDEVHIPTVYENYFSRRMNKDLYVRHKYSEEYRKRNSRFPTCARSLLDADAGTHFCDVLGKRFCKCCEEYSNRLFSWKYERRKLLPFQSFFEY